MKKAAHLIATGLAVTLLSSPLQAQQLRRCYIDGHVVMQQERCPEKPSNEQPKDRYLVPGPGGAQPPSLPTGENPIDLGRELCRTSVAKSMSDQYPGYMRVGEPLGGKMELTQVHGATVSARAFHVPVDGTPVLCHVSQDGRRLLKISDVYR